MIHVLFCFVSLLVLQLFYFFNSIIFFLHKLLCDVKFHV